MKTKTKFVAKLWGLVVGIMLCGCGHTYKDDWKGEMVTSPGTYVHRGKKITLTVKIIETSIVFYQITNQQGKVIIQSKESMSNAMRWGLFLDKKDRFWSLSSDIGDHVWIKDSLGTYQQYQVKPHSPVPKEVYDFMPSSNKDVYSVEK